MAASGLIVVRPEIFSRLLLGEAEEAEVSAVVVLTDGYIDYPSVEPPYHALWVLLGEADTSFSPPYGQVVRLELDAAT